MEDFHDLRILNINDKYEVKYKMDLLFQKIKSEILCPKCHDITSAVYKESYMCEIDEMKAFKDVYREYYKDKCTLEEFILYYNFYLVARINIIYNHRYNESYIKMPSNFTDWYIGNEGIGSVICPRCFRRELDNVKKRSLEIEQEKVQKDTSYKRNKKNKRNSNLRFLRRKILNQSRKGLRNRKFI